MVPGSVLECSVWLLGILSGLQLLWGYYGVLYGCQGVAMWCAKVFFSSFIPVPLLEWSVWLLCGC